MKAIQYFEQTLIPSDALRCGVLVEKSSCLGRVGTYIDELIFSKCYLISTTYCLSGSLYLRKSLLSFILNVL